MDEIDAQLADAVEQPEEDLINIADDNHDVDHAQVVEELNSFERNNPDADNFASEHLKHGIVLPTVFAGIAIVQFLLACAVFACLIYFIIRDYMELQQRRRLHIGNMRVVPGEEHGGDNNANDDDDDEDDDRRGVGLPPAAPEGTPPSQFPSDIVRHRVPAAPAGPPPPPPPAPSAGAPRPVAVQPVSPRPLTVVDRNVPAAAATAATVDGGSVDDSMNVINRLQSGGAGAKPKKIRYARKHQSTYRPRTTEGDNDETSSPTITDVMDVVSSTSATTATDSEHQRPADVTSASKPTDSTVSTPQSTVTGVDLTAPPSRSSTVDDHDGTADQAEAVAVDRTTDVVPQPSVWNGAPSTADDPVTARRSRRVGLFDEATTTTTTENASLPTSFVGLRTPSAQTDSHSRRQFPSQQPPPQLQRKSQQWNVVCENGVCRLRVATSSKQCHEPRSFATSEASSAATDLPSTVRDAKSESRASEAATLTSKRETTQLDVVSPLTLDIHSVSGVEMTADGSTTSPVNTIQPSSHHSSGSAPVVGGGTADVQGHGITSHDDDPLDRVDENTVVSRTEESGSLNVLPQPDTTDPDAWSPCNSFSQPPAAFNVIGAASGHIPNHEDDEAAEQVVALTAAAEAVVRHSTAAAVAPLILTSTDDVEELTGVDNTGEKRNSTTTL